LIGGTIGADGFADLGRALVLGGTVFTVAD
jgi:hypothetical protein